MEAHGRYFCQRTTRVLLETIGRRTGLDPGDHRLRLCLEMLVGVVHVALDDWSASDGPGLAELLGQIRTVCDAAPGSLTVTAVG
ncbi:hypothetical protein [Pseudonocardia sediminis]|uniref:acyl-CoA-like ligand-binding transcription factor n=1 Tax=Pseudonocardia sediminis TaxID=1397368 RepID=UPI001F5FDF89|nr:hypothetical protein [Pseudonocardia sediminis]